MLQYKQYALKELMLQYKQHALKGQKLLAQGTALGYYDRKPVALQGQKLSPKQKNTPLIYNVESGKNALKPPHLVKYH